MKYPQDAAMRKSRVHRRKHVRRKRVCIRGLRGKEFSKAAQKLYITQPALSTAIKKVEKKIGTPIFDRSTSPIGLTPGGEVYIDAIEKLFALEQNTLNQLNNLNGLLAGKLSVGGTIFLPRLYFRAC